MRPSIPFLAGLLLGGAACYGLVFRSLHPMALPPAPPSVPLVVRLHRFKVDPASLSIFDEWMQFEHANHAETVATLNREQMYVEAIFRDREQDPTTIYWLEVRSPDGASSNRSPLPIDETYDQFERETLVPHSRRTLLPEYTLVPDFLMKSISAQHEELLQHASR